MLSTIQNTQHTAAGNQYFKESLVEELTPWKTVERHAHFPDNFTFPAMCGSGVIFYGLDATGFQSINFNLASKHVPSNGSTADDLYVFHEAMHSNHLQYDDLGKYPVTQMPLGYMTFSIIVDGVRIAPGLFISKAYDWQRVIDLKTGITTTSYSLPGGIRLTIEHVLLMGSSCPQFRLSAESTDNEPHVIDFRFELKPRTRYGVSIWDKLPGIMIHSESRVLLGAEVLRDGAYQPPEDYAMAWGLCMKDGRHAINTALVEYIGINNKPVNQAQNTNSNAQKITLTAEKRLNVSAGKNDGLEWVVYFGSSATDTHNTDHAASVIDEYTKKGFDQTATRSTEWWNNYFSHSAAIQTGDVKADYLFHRSLQLFTTGIAFHRGAPPSFQFVAGSPWWSNSSFHDSMYIVRGLIQANMKGLAQDYVIWMRDYQLQKEERPIYWITRYDGYPITKNMPEGEDKGYLAVTTLGLIPLMYTEAFGKNNLKDIGTYQMIRQIIDYCSKHLIKQDGDNYVTTISAANDVRSDAYKDEAGNDAYLSLTMKPLYRKACEYAIHLDTDADKRNQWLHIAENLFLLRDEQGYILRNDKGEKEGTFMTWTPAFSVRADDLPTPPGQIALWKSFNANAWQAWGQFVSSACGIAWNDGAYAYERLSYGISEGSFGTGYISEIFLRGHNWHRACNLANLPPFSTAHGSFLFAMVEHFTRGNIWDNTISIGPLPGSRFYDVNWSFVNFRTLNGALVSAEKTDNSIQGEISPSNNHSNTAIRFIKPESMKNKTLQITLNNDNNEVFKFEKNEEICISLSGDSSNKFTLEVAE